jgi:hypothetical protein
MNEQVFWKIIEQSVIENTEITARFRWIAQELSNLTEKNIFKFDKVVHFLLGKSNTEDLWAASYVLTEEVSSEQFLVFRYWLMLQGQRIFKKAINDAEYLEIFTDDFKNKAIDLDTIIGFKYFAERAYEIKTKLKNYQETFPYDLKTPNIDASITIDTVTVSDLVPLLCKKMGWDTDFIKGTWKSDETPF